MNVLKILLFAVGLCVVLAATAILVAGTLIPAEQSFENEVEINAPAERVWSVITDRARFMEWQDQLDKVELTDEKTWVEYPKGSPEPLIFRVASDERPGKMEFHYTMGDSFAGHWRGEITATPTGVRLRTTDGYSTNGWLTKIMIYVFFDMESFAKEWNAKLKARVESTH